MAGATRLRWRLEGDDAQGALFDEVDRHVGRGEFRGMEFLHVRARSIINSLPEAAHLPFRHTINAYRGCSHACSYCFARPTHEYLGLGAGEDFEKRIVVKVNAVERLRAELAPKRWAGEAIAMGTNTDPYQRCEGKYRLTRGIVETLSLARNPFSILTKSTLVLRDLDLLAEAAQRTRVQVSFSIGTLDDDVWKSSEPGTPHPLKRVEALARLHDAGISCGVLVGPVLPGLSDSAEQIDRVVKACADAGAESISGILLHLRPGVKEQFMPWLEATHPELVLRYMAMYPRANAPRADQHRIQALVREALARHRGRVPRSRAAAAGTAVRVQVHRPPPPAGPAGDDTASTEQLGLGL